MAAQAINTNGAATTAAPATFSEAPASINVRVVSPAGFDYQLTMRAARVGDVLNQAQELEKWLINHDWKPAGQRVLPTGNSVPTEDAPLCAIHKVPMARKTKDGRSWWSCSHKLDDGSWCPYRPPK
jgi:hypothetical protein